MKDRTGLWWEYHFGEYLDALTCAEALREVGAGDRIQIRQRGTGQTTIVFLYPTAKACKSAQPAKEEE